MLCIVILNKLLDILETDILLIGYAYLRFYPGIEIVILPRLSYQSCHVSALHLICCIGTHAHCLQVTSK